MDGKEVYSGLYEMLSYVDVLRHIAEKHGPDGESIIKNSQEMPVIWHELQHLNGDLNHLHLNNHREALEDSIKLLEKLSTDTSFLEEVMEFTKKDVIEENFKIEEYIQELDSE